MIRPINKELFTMEPPIQNKSAATQTAEDVRALLKAGLTMDEIISLKLQQAQRKILNQENKGALGDNETEAGAP